MTNLLDWLLAQLGEREIERQRPDGSWSALSSAELERQLGGLRIGPLAHSADAVLRAPRRARKRGRPPEPQRQFFIKFMTDVAKGKASIADLDTPSKVADIYGVHRDVVKRVRALPLAQIIDEVTQE